jgi:hypothetical protein
MASLAQFRAEFPEMNGVSDPLISTKLAAAFVEIDQSVWGAIGQVGGNMTPADQGQLYLAAHKLASSPFGQNAKTFFNNKNGFARTTYGQEFVLLRAGRISGFRVA